MSYIFQKLWKREVANHYRDNKNPKSTYVNSIYSEYVSCNIGNIKVTT